MRDLRGALQRAVLAGLLGAACSGLRAAGRVLPAPPLLELRELGSWWASLGPVGATFSVARVSLILLSALAFVTLAAGATVTMIIRASGAVSSRSRPLNVWSGHVAAWSAGRPWHRLLLLALGLSATSGLITACGGGAQVDATPGGAPPAPELVGPTAPLLPVAADPVPAPPVPAPASTPPASRRATSQVVLPRSAAQARRKRTVEPAGGQATAVHPATLAKGETAPAQPVSPVASGPVATQSITWTIRSGDDFWSIAEAVVMRHGPATQSAVGRYWTALLAANEDRLPVPGDPDLLFPGDRVVLPPLPSPAGPDG